MMCCAKQPHMQQLSKSACGLRAAKHRPAPLPSYHNNCSPLYGTSSQQIHCFDRTTIPAMHAACKKTHVSMQLVVAQHTLTLGYCPKMVSIGQLLSSTTVSVASILAGVLIELTMQGWKLYSKIERQASEDTILLLLSYNKLGSKPSLH